MDWLDLKYANPDEGLHIMRKVYVSSLKQGDCKTIYQFGVWCGHSIIALQKLFNKFNLDQPQIYGFDSFIGLPKEEKDIQHDSAWKEGNFSAIYDLNCKSPDEAIALIKNRLPYPDKANFIPGFYEKTLSGPLSISPADYIDIDCDIYSSACQALDFVFRNCLYQYNKFSVIGYHDWGATPLFKGGESKAHIEKCKQYNILYREIWSNQSNILFVIV